VLCFSPTHRFVRAKTQPQANAPAPANPKRNTATAQNDAGTLPDPDPSLFQKAKPGARPTLRTRPAIYANLGQGRGRRIKGHETLTSGSWPMPRWAHRFKDKMCIFTNRNNAERLEGFAAQAIAAKRYRSCYGDIGTSN